MDEQDVKIACMVVCPWCDERKCVGRHNCQQIADYLKKMEVKDNERT